MAELSNTYHRRLVRLNLTRRICDDLHSPHQRSHHPDRSSPRIGAPGRVWSWAPHRLNSCERATERLFLRSSSGWQFLLPHGRGGSDHGHGGELRRPWAASHEHILLVTLEVGIVVSLSLIEFLFAVPFPTDIEVTGQVSVELYAKSSALDTDFTARLVDVWPNGFAPNLTQGIVRARHRDSQSEPSRLVPSCMTRTILQRCCFLSCPAMIQR